VLFLPREIQPTVRYRFALDGSETVNAVSTGRPGPAPVSTAAWDGDRLVITTRHPYPETEGGAWLSCEVTQTLWLEPADGPPWEPSLVVETRRGAAFGGSPSVTRTVYAGGYR
jgi:hypothetical protein